MSRTQRALPFDGARWISRPAPPSQRIVRETKRDRVDWASPGTDLSQSFDAPGPVRAISVDLAGPDGIDDPYAVDVSFSISLETTDGHAIARKEFTGPQILWERFSHFVEVPDEAPPGKYCVRLRADRGRIGWYAADAKEAPQDNGVSPLPVAGQAYQNEEAVAGVRLLAVETDPAPNPWFRSEFHVDGALTEATINAVVLGCGVVRINGTRVGDEAIEPAVTDYDKRILYRPRLITHLLRQGRNEIVIEAGRERYSARGGDIWGWNIAPWHREPTAIAKISLEYSDGRTDEFATGPGWECAPGPVESEILFRGETWVLSDKPLPWSAARVVDPPRGSLQPATQPPIRALDPVAPVAVEQLTANKHVYDFATLMTGRVRCMVSGTEGSVRVTYGEQRDQDSSVVCDNVLTVGADQEDSLRLESPQKRYLWEPQFGYRGFRWMQVETEGDVVVELVQAVPISTELAQTGEFTSSDPLISWIDASLASTFLNNVHGIPTDTPIYEKNGWTADAHLATEALLHHFDLKGFLGKWMEDHVDAQTPEGAIPQIIPTPGWGTASDPAWSASAVLIPWYLYEEYGDRGVLQQFSPMIRRFADDIMGRLREGIWRERSWSDWLAPGYGIPPEGMAPVATAMAVSVFQHTSSVLRELGEFETAALYHTAAQRSAAAYHETYFDRAAGHYAVPDVGYRQSLNILPLAFNMVPDEHTQSVQKSLIQDIESRTLGHLDCGAIGVRHLLPVLSDAGRDDLALTVLTQRSRPGWGVWFDNGERTLLESWDTNARSRNHYFLGSVASWIQQRIGGLRRTSPGWKSFEISPVDDRRLTHASIRHLTPLGEAKVHWERGEGGWLFSVTVPDGASAIVRAGGTSLELPAGEHQTYIASPAPAPGE